MLRVEKLKVGRLPPLSFAVAGAECLSIEGPSGSGKSRLLRAVADLDDAQGYVFLEGAERREMPAPEWRRRVRYIASEPGWWAATGREHFPAGAGQGSRLERLLDALGLDARLLDQPIGRLSTGERLRLALARGLMDEPRVLLLDEPTAALDAQSTALVDELIKFQLLAGRAVLLVSHDPAEIARLAHQRLQLGAVDHLTPQPGGGRAR
ncbi:MAG: ATP-binding cassette domain-containing protein [Hyphomicrobiaceae bacterium]|nr:ATP-binding cassette domain-containing protein [Hyphomicrobiaceae bacterium]